MIPIVAVGVAVQYAKTRKQFDSVAGLYKNGYRSKIRDDLFYWNHFNTNRQGLSKYHLSLRWLFHVLQQKVDSQHRLLPTDHRQKSLNRSGDIAV
jgi:hypothetical protein